MARQYDRLSVVISRIKTLIEEDNCPAEMFNGLHEVKVQDPKKVRGDEALDNDNMIDIASDKLDILLDELRNNDAFGTEGASDPRGDFRNDEYSMWYVEGVDDE